MNLHPLSFLSDLFNRILMQPESVMPCRYTQLKEALLGYNLSGVPLIGFDGTLYKPTGIADEPGLFYFLPILANLFKVDIDTTIILYSFLITLFSVTIAALGFYRLFSTRASKIIALAAISAFALYALSLGNFSFTYSAAGALATIPWGLYFLTKKQGRVTAGTIAFILLAGLCIHLANFLRSHAGTPILIFLVCIIIGSAHLQKKHKILLIGLLISIVFLGNLHSQSLIKQREKYLALHAKSFRLPTVTEALEKPVLIVSANKLAPESIIPAHPFWHTIYIGLGYLSNNYGLVYLDECAMLRVAKINPNVAYLSKEYEKNLRDLTLRVFLLDPFFVFSTLFAKAGHIFMYLLIYANIGLFFILLRPPEKEVNAAFILALLFCALNGLLVMPYINYLIGFCAFAVCYGLIGINQILDNGSKKNLTRF